MMNWKKEIEKIEASIVELHLHLTSLPAELQDSKTGAELRALIESARKKMEILKESERRFW